MARIPNEEIERLKAEVSVERLVEASGVALQKAGKDLIGKCPFHEDDSPSLVVTPAKNLWHCFGCGAGGGPIDWAMRRHGVSFRHAIEMLREGPKLDSPRQHSPRLAAPVAFDADDRALLGQVVDYYHGTLKSSPEALAYLKTRGLDHPELVERFKLGYANRTLGLRLPEKNRRAGAEIRSRLEQLGIYRASGHEHFNGSLVVPVVDAAGTVTELYGRKIRDDLRSGTPKHLYLPRREGVARGIWNAEALQAAKEVILCEALIDAMSFWCAGFRNVTTAYGIEGFTDELFEAFKTHGTERVLIAYDRDDPGELASDRLGERLMASGIECFRIAFPKGMDANEYALKVTPSAKSFGLLIRKAYWMGRGRPSSPPTSEPIAERPIRKLTEPAARTTEASPVAPASMPAPSLPASSLAAKEEAMPSPTPATSAAPVALPASPMPPAPAAPEIPTEVKETEIVFSFGEGERARRWRVRGLAKNLGFEALKVNVLVGGRDDTGTEAFHVDTLDLYSARARGGFVTQAAVELRVTEDVIRADLGRVLLKLEALQEEAVRKHLEPKPAEIQLAEADREAALELLRAPDLLSRILADFEACGVVGERTNKLVGYLAAVSRKLDRPLAVLIQSSSAAGKSSLMDAILAFMPELERVKYSAMTGQSLFYIGETNLRHKILAICEEEGASRAAYALKLLQSEGELSIASTGKDPESGNLITQEYRVQGPVMILLTTTAIEIDEELLNRCLVLTVDEGRDQTEAIHAQQRRRRTLAGLLAKEERGHLTRLHQNAQSLLKPLAVVNPFAERLTFLSDKTRTRRDHEKYLTLIDAIALLHQHQRPAKTTVHRGQVIEYVEVTLGDIEAANAIAHEVLGRSLDELPPQTRRLLAEIRVLTEAKMTALGVPRAEIRLTRRDIRQAIAWNDTQLRVHLDRLVALEYLLVHRGARGQSFVYELLYDGALDMQSHLSGLIDVTTMASSRGQSTHFAGPTRPQRGVIAPPSRPAEIADSFAATSACSDSIDSSIETHLLQREAEVLSYIDGEDDSDEPHHRSNGAVPVLPLAAQSR